MRHVIFGYTPDRQVLRDISFRVPAGTQVAIVGPTGGGKTTLINLLTRFYDVSDGSILLDGHDLREYRLSDLRDAFGVVLQDTALFAESVTENIRFGQAGTIYHLTANQIIRPGFCCFTYQETELCNQSGSPPM